MNESDTRPKERRISLTRWLKILGKLVIVNCLDSQTDTEVLRIRNLWTDMTTPAMIIIVVKRLFLYLHLTPPVTLLGASGGSSYFLNKGRRPSRRSSPGWLQSGETSNGDDFFWYNGWSSTEEGYRQRRSLTSGARHLWTKGSRLNSGGWDFPVRSRPWRRPQSTPEVTLTWRRVQEGYGWGRRKREGVDG